MFAPDDKVFVDQPQLISTASTSASAISNAVHSKLPPWAIGPAHKIFVRLHTITTRAMVISINWCYCQTSLTIHFQDTLSKCSDPHSVQPFAIPLSPHVIIHLASSVKHFPCTLKHSKNCQKWYRRPRACVYYCPRWRWTDAILFSSFNRSHHFLFNFFK